MYITFLFAITLLIGCLLFFSYQIVTNNKFQNKILIFISILIIVALAMIAYCVEPKETNDLYRHFKVVNLMKDKGFFALEDYDSALGAKILFYAISFLPNNHWLPSLVSIIVYGIFMYIIYDFNKTNETKGRVVAISVLLFFSMCMFATVVSGIRNALAFAFIALALYRDLIKKDKIYKCLWMYILAISIHPASWIVILIRILFWNKNIEKLRYFVLLAGICVRILYKILMVLNFKTNNYLMQKLFLYMQHSWKDDIRLLITLCILLVGIYIVLAMLKKRSLNKEHLQFVNFLQLFILCIFSLSFIDQIFIKRMTILLAFLMITIVNLVETRFDIKTKKIIYGITLVFICGLLSYSVVQVKGNMNFIFLN